MAYSRHTPSRLMHKPYKTAQIVITVLEIRKYQKGT